MKWTILTRGQGSPQDGSKSSSKSQQQCKKWPGKVEIDTQQICSVVFLLDGEYIASGSRWNEKIHWWRVKDGREVGTPMDAGDQVRTFSASRDGKRFVSGMGNGRVEVWNAENYKKVIGWQAYSKSATSESRWPVDISPDGTNIVTVSDDSRQGACVWLISTAQPLPNHGLKSKSLVTGPYIVALKFSPDGRSIASITSKSIQIYDSLYTHCLSTFPIQVKESNNKSISWTSDSKKLFALSSDGNIHCLNVSAKTVDPGSWAIHDYSPKFGSIALARNGAFIAASASLSVSFWDTATHQQIGSIICHPTNILCMDISENYDLVTAGGTKIILWDLHQVLPSPYCDDVSVLASNTRSRSFSS